MLARETEMLQSNIQYVTVALEALKPEAVSVSSTASSITSTEEAHNLRSKASDLMGALNDLSLSRFQLLSSLTDVDTNQFRSTARTGLPSDFDTFKASLPAFLSYEQSDGAVSLTPADGSIAVRYHVVEEDVPMDELDLLLFFQQASELIRVTLKPTEVATNFTTSFTSADPSGSRLIQTPLRSGTELGAVVRWLPGATLKYCILKWTFGADQTRYEMIKTNMEAASKDWEGACNIHFEHVVALDSIPHNMVFPTNSDGMRQVLFVVAQKSIGSVIAMSFFPNDPIYKRLLFIDLDNYYRTAIDKVGILRHEIGHILGFRHEHISREAPVWSSSFCSGESTNKSVAVTAYDQASVMHYPCESALKGGPLPANLDLRITNLDKIGAQAVYGPPGGNATGNFTFRDFDASP